MKSRKERITEERIEKRVIAAAKISGVLAAFIILSLLWLIERIILGG